MRYAVYLFIIHVFELNGSLRASPTTESPTLPPGSVAFGGYRDPTDSLIFCDRPWTYRKQAGADLVDVTDTQADNCLSIDDPDTRPYNHGSQEHNFPALSAVVQQTIPFGYTLDETRWCSYRQGKCGGTSTLYRPDAQTPDGSCATAVEVREAWGFCMKPATPTPAPVPVPASVGNNETFALAGFRDPADPLIECDQIWSYRESGGAEFPEVFPDPIDNCLPIDTYPPFFKTDPNVDYDYDPSDNDVLQAVPPGYEILPNRWCSIKRNVDVCGPTANSLYRPDATNAQGTCSLGETYRAWAFCVRPIGEAGGTLAPTQSPIPTPEPTTAAEQLPRAVQGFTPVGNDNVGVACDTNWFYRAEQGGSLIAADSDGCMSIENLATQPFRWATPDFPANSTAVGVVAGVSEIDYTRWCSHKQNTYGTGNNYYTNETSTVSGSATGPGQLMRAWGYCLKQVESQAPTPYPTSYPTTPTEPTEEPTALPTTQVPTQSPSPPQTSTPSRSPTTSTPTQQPTQAPSVRPTENLYDIGIYTSVGLIALVLVALASGYFTGATGVTGFITTEGAAKFQPIRTEEAFTLDLDIEEEVLQRALRRIA